MGGSLSIHKNYESVTKNFESLSDPRPLPSSKYVMELLLRERELNEIFLDGMSPLSFALVHEYHEAASFLIKAGTDMNTPDVNGLTPIYHAIRQESPIHIIEEMLSKGALLKNGKRTQKYNISLLQRAIMEKNVSLTKSLLEKSINPNVITDFGVSPLNLTIKIKCLELMKILMSHGANLDGQGGKDPSPVYLALGVEIRYLKELIKSGLNVNETIRIENCMAKNSHTTALHVAVAHRNLEAVIVLVQNGALVNASQADEQCTPLHTLALKNNGSNVKQKSEKEIASFLLERGGDMNANCSFHGTPVDAILQSKNWTVLEVFIRNGVDVNKPMASINDMSIFHCTIINNINRLVQLCVDFGADCSQSFQGKLPIYFAIKTKNSKTVEFLFKKTYCLFKEDTLKYVKSYGIPPILKYLDFYDGVKTNNATKVRKALGMGASPGRNTIHYASAKKNPDVVRALLEYGEPSTSLDSKGYCPLQIAVKKGAVETCLILLRHGACFNYCNPRGDTALILAKGSKNKGIIKVLEEISNNFNMVENGEVEILNILKKLLECKMSKSKFFCYINSTNKKGNTLMTEAFYHGFDDIGKEIMKLRLKALTHM